MMCCFSWKKGNDFFEFQWIICYTPKIRSAIFDKKY